MKFCAPSKVYLDVKMIRIKKKWEIERMKRAGLIVADVLKLMNDLIRPGVDTRSLDVRAEEMITKSGGVPAFKGYSFPGAPCPFQGASVFLSMTR